MAIQVVSITKGKDGMYSVTIQDTGDVVSIVDEVTTYRTYSLSCFDSSGAKLKRSFEQMIGEQKEKVADTSTFETAVKASLESIDTSKIGVG